MNIIKNILLILTLAMPVTYADTKQPWYTRIFTKSPAILIVGTTATTGILTSLAWYYFGVRPLKKQKQCLESKLSLATSLSESNQQDLSNISKGLSYLTKKKNKQLIANQTTLSSLKKERAAQQDKKTFARARVANVSSQRQDDRIADADRALHELEFKEMDINMDNVILQSELYSLNALQTRLAPQKESL
ncbi:MAG: hypothetical protein M1114_00695 [Candidatus Dependentiae bacterium]|nr:hypothetical protein [Candidatus Dependentiae bacterium]